MAQRQVYMPRDMGYFREALARLREYFPKDSEAWTVVKHRTASGNQVITVLHNAPGVITNTSHDVARVLALKIDSERDGVVFSGSADLLISQLSYRLHDASTLITNRPI